MIELQSPPEAHYTVYKLTGPNGKVYIGQTGEKPEVRWKKGYQRNSPMGRAVREYGMKAFRKEILCEKLTKEGADKLEKWFVEYYDSMDPEKGYNGKEGGANRGTKMNEAGKERKRQAKLRKYREDPALRQRLADITISYYEGKPENAMKSSLATKRCYEERPELREMVREQMKKRSAEGKNRAFLESSHRAKPVVCIETGENYPSASAAERATGFKGIHKACSGLMHTSGGCHWRFAG